MTRNWSVILLTLALLASSPELEAAPPACLTAVTETIRARQRVLDAEGYEARGFLVQPKDSHGQRPIAIKLSAEDWAQAERRISREFKGMENKSKADVIRAHDLKPVFLTSSRTPTGLKLEGSRYILERSGNKTRFYRMDLVEEISRAKDGSVQHYISVNVWEVDAKGRDLKQIAYADSPHVTRDGARWFHAHDKETGAVVDEIATPGHVQSAAQDVMTWARRYIKSRVESARDSAPR